MYSDLFDALGGGGGPHGSSSHANHVNNNNNASDDPKALYSFKAGKVVMALQDDGKYSCIPDTRRGQVNLKYVEADDDTTNHNEDGLCLVWEWYDRREKKVVDTIPITDPVTLVRASVPPSQDKDVNDRVYYWKLDNEYRMIWLQDKEEDPELISKANEILQKPRKQTTDVVGTTPATTGAAAGAAVDALRSPGDGSTSSVSTTTRQVDALSNILENLGMPQGPTGAAPLVSDGAIPSNTTNTLTLADLQGVFAGLQSTSAERGAPPPSLSDIVTPAAITELLTNESVRDRLLQELPEEQRSMEYLEENLRSPQVQQTLRSLSSALVPDDNGSLDGYHSVLANFQLDAADGQRALAESNNPIQAFLDCVLASVEKEKTAEEGNDEEMKED